MNVIDKMQGCRWMVGIAMMAAAMGAGAETMTKAAPGVTRVVFNSVGELTVKPGTDEKVVVEAEQKVLDKLDISVKGDTLVLSTKGSFRTDKGIKYTVTVKSFRSLKTDTSASGNSTVDGFSGNDVDVELNGSGDVGLKNLKYGRLGIVVKSAGNVKADGGGKTVSARIDGSGNIDTTGYQAQVVDARIDGSGTIRVHADETLKAAIGGAGNIEYKGKAKVTQAITGAGSVDRI
jgi:hypothetical protein